MLGEANNQDIRRKEAKTAIKRSQNGVKFLSGESLNLWGKQRNESLNLRLAKDTLNGMRGNKEKLTMHGHLKADSDHNIMHVLIEHVNKMGIGSPLERKQSPNPTLE